MSKVKEITEEQFKCLAELGMPVFWDYQPMMSEEYRYLQLLRSDIRDISLSRYRNYCVTKEADTSRILKFCFFTLVEGSTGRSEDE